MTTGQQAIATIGLVILTPPGWIGMFCLSLLCWTVAGLIRSIVC